jgi:YD repeat-containing protein
MTAITAGAGLGLERSSAFVLGSRGQLGVAAHGRSGENVWVNASDGNLVVQRTDEMLIGNGTDDSVTRTYNSQSGYTPNGWMESFQRKVTGLAGTANTTGSTVKHIAADGSDVTYTYNTTGAYAGLYTAKEDDGPLDTLAYSGGVWTWTEGRAQTRETYDSANGGRLTSRVDLDGNTLGFTYNPSGQLVTITTTDTSGHQDQTNFAYTAAGLVQSIQTSYWDTVANGQATLTRVYYGYDTLNRLTSVTVDLSPKDGSTADGNTYVTTYGYDYQGTDPTNPLANLVNTITQTDGTSLRINYTQVGSAYRVSSLVQQVGGGISRTTTFTYDTTNRVTTITDPLGQATSLTYDTSGNLTQLSQPSGQVTQFTYDGIGNVLTVVQPGGLGTITYGYDGNGNRISQVDPAGDTVSRTFNAQNQLLTETHYLTPAQGQTAAANPVTTRYAYNSAGHVHYRITGDGRVAEYLYDGNGNQTAEIDYAGNLKDLTGLNPTDTLSQATMDAWRDAISDKSTALRTNTTYDLRGNISTVTTFSHVLANGTGDSTWPFSRTTYVYDQAGKLLSRVQSGSSAQEVFNYDGLGRLISSTDFNNQTTTIAFHDAANTTLVTLATGAIQTSVLDRAGELISYTETANSASIDKTTYTYDADGRLTMQADMIGQKTYYLYDSVGRKIADVQADGALTEYKYNANNQLIQTIQYANKLTAAQIASLEVGGSGTVDIWLMAAGGAHTDAGGGAITPDWRVVATADFNGDGKADILWRNDNGDYRLWTFNASGGHVETDLGVIDATWRFQTAADFNGDGKADILWVSDGGLYRLWNFNASGSYTIQDLALGVPNRWHFAAAADFNGDGRADILWRNDTGACYLWFMNSSGIQSSSIATTIDWQSVQTGDFNGDGKADMLWRKSNGEVRIWYFTATGTYTDTSIGGSSGNWAGWAVPKVADFDGNGRTDIVWRNDAGLTQIGYYDTSGNLSVVNYTATTTDWNIEQVADFNGDGKADILWRKSNGEVRLWTGLGPGGTYTDTSLGGADGSWISWRVPKAADFNGDGKADIFWRQQSAVTLASVRPASAAGDRYQYRVYDSAGRLAETIDPTGAATVYAYDGASRLTSTTAYYNPIAPATFSAFQSAPPSGVVLPTALPAADKVVRNFYDGDGDLVGTLDGLGYFTQTLYDAAGRKTQTIGYANQTSSSLWAGGTFAQLLASATSNPTLTPNDVHNWFIYDSASQLRGQIDGEGNVSRYDYDSWGNLQKSVRGGWVDPATLIANGPPAWTSLSNYDAGHTLDVTNYTFNQYHQVLSKTQVLAGSVNDPVYYTYDPATRGLISQTKSSGLELFKYDQLGRLIQELTPAGNAALVALGSNPTTAQVNAVWQTYGTTYAYDADNRLISKVQPDGAGGAGNRTLYYYNIKGQLVYTVNALGETTEYQYDTFGERSETFVYSARLSSTSLSTMTGGLATASVITAVGALANASNDSHTHFDYNASGTLADTVSTVSVIGGVTTTATTYFGYDSFGDLTSRQDPIQAGTWVQTQWTYDQRGMKGSEVRNAGGSGPQAHTGWGYDAFGNVQVIQDPNNNLSNFTYYRTGLVHTKSDNLNRVTTYGYDTRNNLASIIDPSNNTVAAYTYDEQERTTRLTIPGGYLTITARNRDGQITSITDADNHQTTYVYDVDGNLKTATDAAGDQVQDSYDYDDRLTDVIDGGGVHTRYAYDAANRVVTSTVDPGGLNLVTGFHYDGKGQRDQVTDPSLVVTTAAYDLQGHKTLVTTDPTGLNLQTIYQYDLSGELLTFQPPGSGSITYTYDAIGRMTQAEQHLTGPNPITQYTYDLNGNVVAKRDGAGAITRYVYDADNRLIWQVDPNGDVTQTTYADYSNEGTATIVRRYANKIALATLNGLPLQITAAQVTGNVSTSASDELTNQVYDAAGRLEFTIDATGRPIRYFYDAAGNLTEKLEYAGTINTGQALRIPYILSQISSLGLDNLSNNHITRYVYDAANREAFCIDAMAGVTSYKYDGAGRQTKALRLATPYGGGAYDLATVSAWVSGHFDSVNDRLSRTLYDTAGRAEFQVDPLGYVSELQYDVDGRVTKQVRYGGVYTVGDSTTAAQLKTSISQTTDVSAAQSQRFGYDAGGRLTFSIDAMGSVTLFGYDGAGRVIKQVRAVTFYAADTDPRASGSPSQATVFNWYNSAGVINGNDQVTRTFYDSQGRVLYTVDGQGYVTGYTPDGVGRVTQKIVYTNPFVVGDSTTLTQLQSLVASAPIAAQTNYVYDGVGNATQVTVKLDSSTNAVTNNTYDAFGNLVMVVDPRNNAGYFYYDVLNRLVLQADPMGYVTQTHYGAIGAKPDWVKRYYNPATNAASISTTVQPTVNPDSAHDELTQFGYDTLDRLTSVTDAENYSEHYYLNAFGDRTRVTNKLGYDTTYIYDQRGLKLSETLPINSFLYTGVLEATSVVNSFSYDAFGNLHVMTEATSGLLNGASVNLTDKRQTTYTYDKNNRLTLKTGDSVNTLSQVDFMTTNRQTPGWTTVYDALGNVVESDDPNGNRTLYYYDHDSRKIAQLTQFDAPGMGYSYHVGTLRTFTYDSAGNVLTDTTYGDLVTLPTPPGGSAVGPVNPNNYRQMAYSYDANNRLKTTTIQNTLLVTQPDQSSVMITNSVTPTIQYFYDANGNLIQQIDADGNSSYFFYDKLGRKIAQVDQAKYLTYYVLDAEGNVTTEERWPVALDIPVSTSSDATNTLRPRAIALDPESGGTNARTTTFTYDRNGRRLTETRANVVAFRLDDNTNSLVQQDPNHLAVAATIVYTYNGLGEVMSKTEATGDVFTYGYDTIGRQTWAWGPTIAANGTTGQHAVETNYDGLGNVSRVEDKGAGQQRTTMYVYSDGARLAQTIDATGFSRYYNYDLAGNVVRQYYVRTQADGTTTTEGIGYRYDAQGHTILQTSLTTPGASWAMGDDQMATYYDAYGEVTGRGRNGMIQETFAYDAAGRLFKTNANDGVLKFYLYDAAGNQTVTLASAGHDLSGLSSPTGVANFLTTNGSVNIYHETIADVAVDMHFYDARGQQTALWQVYRQTAASTFGTIITGKTYNAFGEVSSETDAASNTTIYYYNTNGTLAQKFLPSVSITGENGLQSTGTPVYNYYYDVSGRLIGTKDADNNQNYRKLLAGTGYGGSQAVAIKEVHANKDGIVNGIVQSSVDIWGDVISRTNEVNATETMTYDGMGRIATETHANRNDGTIQLVETYVYDGLGQRMKRIEHWSATQPDYVETTFYDQEGRVTRDVDYAGYATNYSYAWAGVNTTGLGYFAGIIKTTVNATGLTATEQTDYFGRTTYTTDFGSHVNSLRFDLGGRMVWAGNDSTTPTQTSTYTYYNTGLVSSVVSQTTNNLGFFVHFYWTPNYNPASNITYTSNFAYDTRGNRTSESETEWTSIAGTMTLENATAQYDALNRLKQYSNTGDNTQQQMNGSYAVYGSTINYEYDAIGNIRHMYSVYTDASTNGNAVQDYWYLYDPMNRFTTTMGVLVDGNGYYVSGALSNVANRTSADHVVRWAGGSPNAASGIDITYDAAGERKTATTTLNYGGTTHTEFYNYTADGFLSTVDIGETPGVQGQASDPGFARVRNSRDAMGRVTEYWEFNTNNVQSYHRYGYGQTGGLIAYDADSHVLHDTSDTLQSDGSTTTLDTSYSYVGNDYAGHYAYQGGGVTSSVARATKNGINGTWLNTATTTNTYLWTNTALMYSISYNYQDPNHNWVNGTVYSYDASWNLDWVKINDGDARQVQYAYNALGQIMSRTVYVQSPAVTQQEYYEYLNGVQLGDTGNNGPSQTDYATAIAQRQINPLNTSPWANSNAASNYAGGPQSYANFDSNYQPIGVSDPGSTPTGYTVQDGDTLQSIAAKLWGDSSLWWLIADANGMTGTETLQAGQTLQIPNKVTNVHNSSSTFEVYDPTQKLGDLQPSVLPTPPPPKHHGACGVIGQIISQIIAVVVTFFTPFGPIGGNIASQLFNMAFGYQKGFSFKSLGMAYITAGVTGPVGQVFSGLNSVIGTALSYAASNAITQGIGVATGLQKKFDWVGVAVAGVEGAVTAGVGSLIDKTYNPLTQNANTTSANAAAVVGHIAGDLAGAGARSLITGTDFGDNVLAVLPNIASDTVGNLLSAKFNQQARVPAKHGLFDTIGAVLNAPINWIGTAVTDVAAGLKGAAGAVEKALQPTAPSSYDPSTLHIPALTQDQIDKIFPEGAQWRAGMQTMLADQRAWFDAMQRGWLTGADQTTANIEQASPAATAPASMSADNLQDETPLLNQDGRLIDVINPHPAPAGPITLQQLKDFEGALVDAKRLNPGPPIGPMHVPEVFGTNFAGNGYNDLANRAYATAVALNMPTVRVGDVDVDVRSFLDPSNYNLTLANAMNTVMQHYYQLIGYGTSKYDPSYDLFHDVPTRYLDLAAYAHDYEQIAAGGNAQLQVKSDLRLAQRATYAAVQDSWNPAWVAVDQTVAAFGLAAAEYQAPPSPPAPNLYGPGPVRSH